MPLCPQITNTPITVSLTADFTVTNVVPVLPADTVQVAAAQQSATDAYNAAIAANTAASTAQTTANGKNKVTYSTSAPGSTVNTSGDIWYQYGTASPNVGRIIAQYMGAGGTSWTQTTVSGLVIANIDAGSITTGTLSVGLGITTGTGTFTVDAVTGALFANSATITGTITSNAGTIAGWILASGSFSNAAADTFLYSNPGTDGLAYSTVGRGIMRRLQLNGASGTTLGTATLAVGGNTTIDGTTVSVGNVTAQSSLINSGIAIQNGTAVHILTGGRLVQSTSSERFKKNIVSIPQGGWLDKVTQIRPVNFQYDEAYSEAPDEIISGLIAEDIAEIPGFEHLIYNDPLGDPFSLSYERLTVFLVMAIKELKAEIDQLKGA